MRIGILGTGTITSAVVKGIAGDGHTITVSNRNATRARELAALFDTVSVAENQAVVDESELILIGLMPDVARQVLPGLRFRKDQQIASLMADVSLNEIATLTTPAQALAILIPFPAIAVGGSPVLVCPKSKVLAEVFGRNNHVFTLPDQAALRSFMAVQALLSPVAKLLEDAATWTALRTGDKDEAERFLRILIGGAICAQPFEQPGALLALLNDLNTKGGLNAELREYFAENGANDVLRRGLDRLEQRLMPDEDAAKDA